jgi:hypothetical protein
MKLGPEAVGSLIEVLGKKRSHIIDPFWIYWHLALCTSVSEDQVRTILAFLAEAGKDQWNHVFSFMDSVTGAVSSHIKCQFLQAIADLLLEKQQLIANSQVTNFYSLCQCFMFSHVDGNTFKDYWGNLTKQPGGRYRFGLRVENGQWLDSELGDKCVLVFLRYLPQHYFRFVLVVIGFLARFDHPKCAEYLAAFRLSQDQLREYANYVRFIMYNTHLSKTSQFFPIPYNPSDVSFDPIIKHLTSSVSVSLQEIETFGSDWERLSLIREEQTRSLLGVDLESLGSELKPQIDGFRDSFAKNREVGEEAWDRIWERFSGQRGPWFIPKSQTFVRDYCACFGGLPSKFAPPDYRPFRSHIDNLQAKRLLEFHCEVLTAMKSYDSTFELFEDRVHWKVDHVRCCLPLKEIEAIYVRNPHRIYFLSVTGSTVLIQLAEANLFALL